MKTIQIGEKHYNAETLTETAQKLINDIQVIENETNRLQIQASINNIAKDTLIKALVEETSKLEEVPAPKEIEETTQA